MPSEKSTDIKDTLMQWLLEEGVEVKKLEAPPHLKIKWGFDVFTPPPLRVNIKIFQPEKFTDRIVVLLGVQVSSAHLAELSRKSKEEKIRFSARLLKGLIGVCSDCSIALQPSLVDFNTISVAKTLFHSSFSRELLVKTLINMINAYLFIIATFNEELPHVVKDIEEQKSLSTTHM